MKRRRFKPEDMVRIVRESELSADSVADVARKNGISEQTLYRWRSRYSGVEQHEALRVKVLERENERLKRLLAERDLEVSILQELNAKKR